MDHIFNGDQGESEAIGFACLWIKGSWAGCDDIGIMDAKIDDSIAADNKIFIGINGFSRSNDTVPIAKTSA